MVQPRFPLGEPTFNAPSLVLEGQRQKIILTIGNSKQMMAGMEQAWVAVLEILPFSYHAWYYYKYCLTRMILHSRAALCALQTNYFLRH